MLPLSDNRLNVVNSKRGSISPSASAQICFFVFYGLCRTVSMRRKTVHVVDTLKGWSTFQVGSSYFRGPPIFSIFLLETDGQIQHAEVRKQPG